MISVEWTMWFTATFIAAAALADGVAAPLVAMAAEQARLNAEGLAVVEAAMAACPAP